MKKIKTIATGFILFILMFTFNSCKKDEISQTNPNNAAAQEFAAIDKNLGDITTQEDDGGPYRIIKDAERTYIPLKNETIGGHKGDETDATDGEMHALVSNMITTSNTQYTGTTSWHDLKAGVVRMYNTCGGWPELSVFMDAEDDNNNSSSSGWLADNFVNGNGNVQLYFCIVEAGNFARMATTDYALLKVENELPDEISEARVFIDNEDHNNINLVKYNGTVINTNQGGPGYLPYSGDMYFSKNCNFDFYLMKKDPLNMIGNLPIIPGLNKKYGVLSSEIGSYYASSGSQGGSIYSDDEDGGNLNNCTIDYWDDVNNIHLGPQPFNSGIPGILDLLPSGNSTHGNSKWHFSKAF